MTKKETNMNFNQQQIETLTMIVAKAKKQLLTAKGPKKTMLEDRIKDCEAQLKDLHEKDSTTDKPKGF